MIFDKLLEIFQRIMPQMDVSKVTMDSSLVADLGVDSLNMMLLAMTVEEEFGIEFDSAESLNTVEDICSFVELKTA